MKKLNNFHTGIVFLFGSLCISVVSLFKFTKLNLYFIIMFLIFGILHLFIWKKGK